MDKIESGNMSMNKCNNKTSIFSMRYYNKKNIRLFDEKFVLKKKKCKLIINNKENKFKDKLEQISDNKKEYNIKLIILSPLTNFSFMFSNSFCLKWYVLLL